MTSSINQAKGNFVNFVRIRQHKLLNSYHATSYKVKNWLKDYAKFRLSDSINGYLLLFVMVYLFIELLYNYALFYQMSVNTSLLRIEDIETYSKVVSGIGIALLICKKIIDKNCVSLRRTIVIFLLSFLVGFGISYGLQKSAVSWILHRATPEDRNGALLISLANASITPVYDDKKLDKHFLKRQIDYIGLSSIFTPNDKDTVARQAFFDKGSMCSQTASKYYGKTHPIKNQIDKAFFGFVGLDDFKREEYTHKQVAKIYHLCMLDNHSYLQQQTELLDPIKSKLLPYYQDYAKASRKYYDSVPNYATYKTQVTNKWTEGISRKFGFASSILPNLSQTQFFNHSDVIKLRKDSLSAYYLQYADSSDEYENKMNRYPWFKNRINAKWQEGIHEKFGAEATIPPGLSENQFYNHPDIIKLSKDSLTPKFQEYQQASKAYNKNLQDYSELKAKAKAQWEKGISKNFSANSKIKPGLSKNDFFRQSAVIKKIKADKQMQGLPYPYAENIKVELKKHPNFIFTVYDRLEKKRQAKADQLMTVMTEREKKLQDDAYKAIVVPMVGLGFSIIFLFLNAFSWISSLVADKSRKIASLVYIILMGVFSAKIWWTLPMLPVIDETFVSEQNSLLQFTYYYEHIAYNFLLSKFF